MIMNKNKIRGMISLLLCAVLLMNQLTPMIGSAVGGIMPLANYGNVTQWRLTGPDGFSQELNANDVHSADNYYVTIKEDPSIDSREAAEAFAESFKETIKSDYTFAFWVNQWNVQSWVDVDIADVTYEISSVANRGGYDVQWVIIFELQLSQTDSFSWDWAPASDYKYTARVYGGEKGFDPDEPGKDVYNVGQWRLVKTGANFNGTQGQDYLQSGWMDDRANRGKVTLTEEVLLASETAREEYEEMLLEEYDRISVMIQAAPWAGWNEGDTHKIFGFSYDFEKTQEENANGLQVVVYQAVLFDIYHWGTDEEVVNFYVYVPQPASTAGEAALLVKEDGDPETGDKCSAVNIRRDEAGDTAFIIYPKRVNIDDINAFAAEFEAEYKQLALKHGRGWNLFDILAVSYDEEMTKTQNDSDVAWPCKVYKVTFGDKAPEETYYIVVYEKIPDKFIVNPKEPDDIEMNLFDYWTVDDGEGNADRYDEAGNPWRQVRDWEPLDPKYNGGINYGHLLKFYYTSPTTGNDGGDSTHYGPWNHSTQGQRANITGIVEPELDENGYPKLQLNKNGADWYNQDPRDMRGGVRQNGWYNNFNTAMLDALRENESQIEAGRTESLDYLFDPDYENPTGGKESFSDVKGLLQMDQDGYYYYDSKLNFAEFDKATKRFILYNTWGVEPNKSYDPNYNSESPAGQFFPFNKGEEVFAGIDKEGNLVQRTNDYPENNTLSSRYSEMNHFFGFTMSVDFQQPTGGMVNHGTEEGDHMVFRFAGDDDVWVYVDGVLVLDMGGTHSGLYGEINFATGEVKVGLMRNDVARGAAMTGEAWINTTLYDLFAHAGKAGSVAWREEGNNGTTVTFADGTIHTLKLFYMERGHWDSNFAMYFNLQSVVEQKLYKVDEDGNPLEVEDAYFELYEAELADADRYDENGRHTSSEFVKVNGNEAKAVGALQRDEETGYLVLLASQNGKNFDFATRAANGQKYYLLEEVKAPTGYRKLLVPIVLEYDSTKQTLKVLNQYEVGAYASFTAILEDNLNELYYATSNYDYDNGNFTIEKSSDKISDEHQMNALMFAVPMIYADIGDGNGANWYPIYGSNTAGYNVVNIYKASDYWKSEDCLDENGNERFPDHNSDDAKQAAQRWALRHNLLAAALRQAADSTAPDWYFQCEEVSNSSGEDVSTVRFRAELHNLPGDADRYLINNGEKDVKVGGADLRLVGLLVDAESIAALIEQDAETVTELDDDGKFGALQEYLQNTLDFENKWDRQYKSEKPNWDALRDMLDHAYVQSMEGTTRERGVNLVYINSFTRNYGSVIYIPNERRELRVLKQDEYGFPLEGATFALFESFNDAANFDVISQTGNYITKGVTDENGLLIFGIEGDTTKAGFAYVNWEEYIASGASDANDNILWVREIKAPGGTSANGQNYALNESIIQVYVGDFTIYANASAYRAKMVMDQNTGEWKAAKDANGNAIRELIDDYSNETDLSKVQNGGTYNVDRVSVMASVGKLFQSMEKFADSLLNTTLLDLDSVVWRNFNVKEFDNPGFRSNPDAWEKTGQMQKLHFWGNDVLKYNSSDYSTAHNKSMINPEDYNQAFVTTDNGYLYVQPWQTEDGKFKAQHSGEPGTTNSRRDILGDVDISGIFSPVNIIVVRDIPSNTKVEVDPGEGKFVDVGDEVTYQIVWENNAKTEDGTGISLPAVITITDTLDFGVDFVEAKYENVILTAAMAAAGEKATGVLEGGQKITISYNKDTRTVIWVIDQAYVGQNSTVTIRVKVNENAKYQWKYGAFHSPAAADDEGYYDGIADSDTLDHQIVNKAHIQIKPNNGAALDYDTPEISNPVPVSLHISKVVTSTKADDKTLDWHFAVTLTPPADITLAPSYTAILKTAARAGQPEVTETVEVLMTENGDGSYTVTVLGHTFGEENTPTITLKHDQTLIIKGLPAGTKYTVSEVEAEEDNGFRTSVTVWDIGSADEEKDITSDKNVKDNVVQDVLEDDRAVKFRNEGTGMLVVSKTVAGEDKSGYFRFRVRLYGPDGEELTGEYAFAIITVSGYFDEYLPVPLGLWGPSDRYRNMRSGDQFILQHGDKLTIRDLPPGTIVEIIEETSEGYYVTWTIEGKDVENDGNTANGEIFGGETTTVNFVNSLTEPKEKGVLHISKVIVGAEDPDAEFKFKITLTDPDGNELTKRYQYVIYRSGVMENEGEGTIASGEEITLKHGQEITIIGLPVGTMYEVEETVDGGYTIAANDEKGTIQLSPQDAIAVFINYVVPAAEEPEEPETGNLKVTKTGTPNSSSADDEFTFTVVLNDNTVNGTYSAVKKLSDGTLQEISIHFTAGVSETITLKHGESITIQGLPAGSAYAVLENEIGENGYHTKASGSYGFIKENQTVEAVYDNSPEEPCEPSEDSSLVITKKVSGNAAETDREFTFEVTFDDGGSYAYHKCNGEEGIIHGSGTITLKPGQRVMFDHIPPGTHYTVTEVEADQDGYTTISFNEKGTIQENHVITVLFINLKEDAEEPPVTETPTPSQPTDPQKPGTNPGTGDGGGILLLIAAVASFILCFCLLLRKPEKSRRRNE